MADDPEGLDKTQYFQWRLYEDPTAPTIPLDLHSACALGNYECVQEAINGNVDLNMRNKVGWTPLMYAAYVGHDTVVNLLLDKGVDTNKGSPDGLTPLMVAAGCGNESVCYFLLQNGASVDVQDKQGLTALCHAARQGHQITVHLLLDSGADIEIAEYSHGYTSLMLAALEGDEIIVNFLISCGADIHARDKDGHSARSLAYGCNHVRTVSLLDDALSMFEAESNLNVDVEGHSGEGEGDLFSGAKEMEMYQQSLAVKRLLRTGSRLSLPQDLFGEMRRSSAPSPNVLRLKQLRLAVSMPESDFPPGMGVGEEEKLKVVKEEPAVDHQLMEFLSQLGLERYAENFEKHEIDFADLLTLSDEDFKRIGVKVGPRCKINLALQELKEQGKEATQAQTEEKLQKPQKAEESRSKRAPLVRQATTELQEAYRQAMERVDHLESQLEQEHRLRRTTENYLQEVQLSRQRAINCMAEVRASQDDITAHTKAVRDTHKKLGAVLESLHTLASSTTHSPMAHLLSDTVSLSSHIGLELEAMWRSVEQAQSHVASLTYHFKATS